MASRTSAKAALIDRHTRILVLHGPDPVLKQLHLEGLVHVLEAAHGPLQTFNYDGRSCELADVLDELRSYTLMQSHKIVIVDDADQFVSAHRDALTRYAAGAVHEATLVLRSDKWHRGNLDKVIQKVGALVKCDAPTADQARTWLIERSRVHHQCDLAPQAAMLLVERIGPDLGRLDSEMAKLVLRVGPSQVIDKALIDEIVGRSSDEQAYVIQEALLNACANLHRRTSASTKDQCQQTIEKIRDLVNLSGQSEVLVSYFVADLVRKLQLGVMMKKQGQNSQAITHQLRLWGRSQSTFMRVLGRLNEQKVASLFDAVVEGDARSKAGLGTARRNLEGFCIRLATALR